MALSRLLQPKLDPRLCRLVFSTARARLCTSLLPSAGSDEPPQLEQEAAAEESVNMAVEQSEKSSSGKSSGFSKEISIADSMAGYGGSAASKRLYGLFKDDLTTTTTENEGIAEVSVLLDFLDETSSIVDKERSSYLDSESIDKEINVHCNVSPPISYEDQRQRQKTSSVRNGTVEAENRVVVAENRVVVRFIKGTISKEVLLETFSCCGEILKIELSWAERPQLKFAFIDFKTREGFKKALEKSGMLFRNCSIIVESANLMERKTVRTPIPGLLGDPDIPPELVKNPTRTIKLENLTSETSSCHIQEALAFCNSNIAGYSLGSSPSVAYVEFETEMGKERALQKQCINVLGRHLVMLRIDCPRTTVVRISTMDFSSSKNVFLMCKSLGNVCGSAVRAPGVIDVQFKLAEWPNMVNILNRLNGCVLDGSRLLAEPATVIPPEVLLALWRHPEGRKHVEATAQVLVQKLLDGTFGASELPRLEDDFIRLAMEN